jgi:septal ring factor EnvC (AmiA/AmiB activator)
MTRLIYILPFLLLACGSSRRSFIGTPEQIATHGRLAAHRFNQRSAQSQKEIQRFNQSVAQLNRLNSVLDIQRDHEEERLGLIDQALKSARKLQKLYRDCRAELERIEETLMAMRRQGSIPFP